MNLITVLNRIKKCFVTIVSLVVMSGAFQVVQADIIPYPNIGDYNATTYSFTAAATGDVTAYIVGGFGAGYENQMGLLVNGVLTSAGFGLDNHFSSVGDSFNLGHVNAGDSLVFVLHNISLGLNAYSNPALNVGYDFNPPGDGQNHIYSTAYTATAPLFAGVPAGTYVAFEDLQYPNSDFNYDDESFVFTNTITTSSVPEPSSFCLLGAALLGAGLLRKRIRL